MSRLCLLAVDDVMHLVISGEKLLGRGRGGRREPGAIGPPCLTLPQKAALLCHLVRG